MWLSAVPWIYLQTKFILLKYYVTLYIYYNDYLIDFCTDYEGALYSTSYSCVKKYGLMYNWKVFVPFSSQWCMMPLSVPVRVQMVNYLSIVYLEL